MLLSDGSTEAAMPLDGDQFYLSLAPYETSTHECYFHNLGTCRGELAGEDVHVTISTDDGEVLVDEQVTTYANGFVGFWIPKDVAGSVVVTRDGKRAESRFSSDAEGPTCLTTLLRNRRRRPRVGRTCSPTTPASGCCTATTSTTPRSG